MNEVLVITGGSKGIGKAVIEKFAAHGFDIITCARNQEKLSELASNLRHNYPDIQCDAIQADVSKKDGCETLVNFVLDRGVTPSVLVNNAGTFIPGAIAEEQDGVLEKMIETNLYSAYRVTRGLLPSLTNAGRGHIINMCSIASIIAYPNGGSYSISKFAMLGMSKVLREELKETGIRVTSVLPGPTYTPSWEASGLPAERFMKAADVADAVFSAYAMSQGSVVEEIVLRPQMGDIN